LALRYIVNAKTLSIRDHGISLANTDQDINPLRLSSEIKYSLQRMSDICASRNFALPFNNHLFFTLKLNLQTSICFIPWTI